MELARPVPVHQQGRRQRRPRGAHPHRALLWESLRVTTIQQGQRRAMIATYLPFAMTELTAVPVGEGWKVARRRCLEALRTRIDAHLAAIEAAAEEAWPLPADAPPTSRSTAGTSSPGSDCPSEPRS